MNDSLNFISAAQEAVLANADVSELVKELVKTTDKVDSLHKAAKDHAQRLDMLMSGQDRMATKIGEHEVRMNALEKQLEAINSQVNSIGIGTVFMNSFRSGYKATLETLRRADKPAAA